VFAYVPFNIANALTVSTVDAKGDLLVGTGADAVGRLAVGTNNQLLAADSSTASGLKWANAGLTLLNSTSFTTQSSVRVNPFSATYQNYRLIFQITQSTGTALKFRLASGASVISTSTYRRSGWYQEGPTTNGLFYSSASETSIVLNDKVNAGISADIFKPFEAATTALTYNLAMENGSVLGVVIGAGYNTNATSYDGFELSPDSGTITGTLRVYGYNQ
jgi:hypothetical protein